MDGRPPPLGGAGATGTETCNRPHIPVARTRQIPQSTAGGSLRPSLTLTASQHGCNTDALARTMLGVFSRASDNQSNAPALGASTAPVQVIEIRRLDGSGNLKAFAKVKLGSVIIHGCRAIQQPGRKAWLAQPQILGRAKAKGSGTGWCPRSWRARTSSSAAWPAT